MTSPPQWSFASTSRPPRGKPVSFPDAVKAIWSWLAGRQPPQTMRQRIAEERLFEKLAEEIEEAETPPTPAAAKRRKRVNGD